jgi:endonuclease/exonuclease/phosphatase family metal-dependent hydrolase
VAVDVIESFPLRFFNTHLEVRYPAENEFAPAIQAAQAIELITIIGLLPPPEGAPVIVVGDINSSPEDEVIDLGFMAIVPPYMQFVDKAGYTEAWTIRPGKPKLRPGKPKLRPAKPKDFTCCQDEDLLNKKSALYERIDVIFSSELPVKVKAKVVGNHKKDKTPSGLWPSDHAGVVARLYFEPFPKPKKHFKAKRRHRH